MGNMVYIKMDQKIINFGDTEIEKQKLHQHKSLIPISNTDINKIVVKRTLNILLFTKMVEKLDLYVYCFKK